MLIRWKKTWYGFAAFVDGHNLTIKKYRRGDGKGWGYVARVDQSAATSPAKPHATIAEAKADAERLLTKHKIERQR